MDERRVKGIVVDAGHGGDDPGASGNGLIEKDLNLQAAKYMAKRLRELGLPVTETRTTDETLPRQERINRILNAYGNDPNIILISNHINAGGGDGAEVIYALRNNDTLAKNVLNEIVRKGQNGRKYYQRRLPENPSKDYYFIHRETGKLEPILIEYGFLDSNKDDISQLKNNFLDYVEGAVKAIADYTNTPYTPPQGQIENDNIYIVQKGDSLWKIANNYNITVEELKAANNLTSNILQIGDTLIIPNQEVPKEPADYSVYIVQKGDTLWSIAQKYNLTPNDLIIYNNLPSTTLQINDQILIPNQKQNNEEASDNTYIVQKGDTLYSIANKYNTNVNSLKELNNLTNNTLSIGQELTIPDNNSNEENNQNNNLVYIVKSGDTLWNIAKKYNINVNDLKNANNLDTNLLSINQELIIPETTDYKTYTVRSGDSLWKIATKYNISVDDLITANNLTNDILSIGQVLIIPN